MKKLLVLLSIFLLGFLKADMVFAAPPTNFQTTLKIGTGLTNPTAFEIAPDGRIFILQRTGEVRIYKNGQLLPTNFTVLPTVSTGDRGLIGIALDPDFINNHYIYFYYTDTDLKNKIVRFDASGDVGTNGPFIIYQTDDQSFQLHVGGTIQFGNDGKIYASIGDNGTSSNAQNLSNVHGKIIRLNKDGSIPSDNPYVNTPNAKPEIWAIGLRNPFRFQFDKTTGYMYEGDVGEATWEEINRIRGGLNFGWPNCEGLCSPTNSIYTDPIYSYNHNGGSASVVGGPVYRGQVFPPAYQGRLFFGDYALGFIRTMSLDSNGNNTGVSDFDTSAGTVVDMKPDLKDGSLYYLTIFPGNLYQITYSTGVKVPVATAAVDSKQGPTPLTVHFSSAGSTDPNGLALTYSWNFGDGTTSTQANPTKTYTTSGKYVAQLTVSNGTYSALASPLTIQVGTPPTIQITSPANGLVYRAGDTISYSAIASDSAGQTLGASALSTTVVFHHQTHIHPFLGPLVGGSGQFTIPTSGEASAETSYEIIVTATDTNGLTTTSSVTINPLKSNQTYSSNVAGLQILLDGQPVTTPVTLQGVVSYVRELSVPFLQVFSGNVYSFHSWSDGGAMTHKVTVPTNDTSYQATFDQTQPFSAQYFSNKTLSGTAALTRSDSIINFDWSSTPPSSALSHDNYSVRWTKSQYFPAGRYTFTTSSDDGNRLYIDNNLVINAWFDQPLTQYKADVDLTAGNHDIRMEFYQGTGSSIVNMNWAYATTQANTTPTPTPSTTITPTPTPLPTPTTSLTPTPTSTVAQRLGGMNLDGYCKSIGQNGSALTGSTWACSPSGTAIVLTTACMWQYNPNAYAKQDVANNPYTWSCYVNGTPPTPTPTSLPTPILTPTLTPTPTPVVPTATPVPSSDYVGKYWNLASNASFPPNIPTSTPTVTRNDTTINFTWNNGSPAQQINVDKFVAQWTKTQNLAAGSYTFTLTSDDGSRVYLDNQLILNQWSDHASTTVTSTRTVTAGNHTLRIDYYENGGGAIARFNFVKN